MAAPALTSYSAVTGQPINGGRWAGGRLTGDVALSAVAPAGTLASATSDLTGNVTLTDMAVAGTMSDGRPSWLTAAAVNEWVAVPGSTIQGSPAWQAMPTTGGAFFGSQGSFVNAENGTGLDEDTSTVYLFGGGHSDYSGNELASISLASESPAWVLSCARSDGADITPYSGSTPPDPVRYADGKPASRHSYSGNHYICKLAKFFSIDGYTWPSATNRCLEPVTWDAGSGTWEAAGTWSALAISHSSSGCGCYAKHPTTEDIYYAPGGGYDFFKLDTSTKAWTRIVASIGGGGLYWPGTEIPAIDPTRNAFVVLTTRSAGTFKCFKCDLATGALTQISFNASADLTAFQALNTDHGGLHYNADQDCFYYYFGGTGQGGKVWKITPNGTSTWDIEQMAMTGVTVPAGLGVANGNLLSRFRYVPALKAVFAFPAYNAPIYAARVA